MYPLDIAVVSFTEQAWVVGIVGLLVGSALGGGVAWLNRRGGRGATPALEDVEPTPETVIPVSVVTEPVPMTHVINTLHDWLSGHEDLDDLWNSLDQMIRETLTEHCGASRVRCYHVRPGSDTLHAISNAGDKAQGPSAREGVLGHVVTTKREYVAGDPTHGPLVHDLAAQDEASWAWVWPVHENGATVGLIAVGSIRSSACTDAAVRVALGQILTLCWHYVAQLDRLRVVQRTDHATGGLTRNEFFALARHALADSYNVNEPVVLTGLSLEGLRRLDDSGRWRERDSLIETIGHQIARRVRSDDLVGRFSDDRFVILLRRLDSGLGKLIAEKILAAAEKAIHTLGLDADGIAARVGLSGSGLSRPSLDDLLATAFDAVERARQTGKRIETDLDDRRPEGVS